MSGIFKKLLNVGAAYVQHVAAVRNALELPEAETFAELSSYLSGLSDSSFAGFKLSLAGMLVRETNNNAKQKLQWVAENADALRQGQLGSISALPEPEPEPDPTLDLSYDGTLDFIDPWYSLPREECREQLHATLERMSNNQRQQFIAHLHAAVEHSRNNLQNLRDNESKAWGGYIEDQIQYQLAKLRTGATDPAYAEKIRTQQQAVYWFEWLAAEAASWQPPEPEPPPAPKPPPPAPKPTPAHRQVKQRTPKRERSMPREPTAVPPVPAPLAPAADGVDAGPIRLMRMMQKVQDGELDEEFFGLLEEDLESSITSGRVAPEREFALREWVAEFRSIADAQRAGQLTGEQVVSETQRVLARRLELWSTAGHHLVSDDSASSARARELLTHLQGIKAFAAGSAIELGGDVTLKAKMDLAARASRAVAHLSTLKDDAAVVAFERNEVRELALTAHELAMLPHLTLARPLWDCPRQYAAPNRVFFAGEEDARRLLDNVCKQKRLDLGEKIQARNYGQSRWDALRNSSVGVFDWRGYKPNLAQHDETAALQLAATAYEQGLSIVLGMPAVVLANTGQSLPFDIDIEPLFLSGNKKTDRATLDAALDTALYSRQRLASDSGLPATSDWLRNSLAEHPRRRSFEGMGWLDPAHVNDPAAFQAAVNQLLPQWGEQAPMVLFPAWRADYPTNDPAAPKRLFHVMPFSQSWSKDVAKAAERACRPGGVIYERGDSSADDRIVRRVWKGICTADFVLVDITGLNPNVMIELGMAHALGRNTLLVEQAAEVGKVRNLEKIEIERYDDHNKLRALIRGWLAER
jgi:hypothetical protein